MYMEKKDMVEILAWLFEAAHLPVSKPPSNTSTSKQPEVSDSDYLLFSLLLKPHLSEKGQSSHEANEDPKNLILTELVRLGTLPNPSPEFVSACLFTCHESG
jgi:hypothetical protein